ncbi:hypothetical protein D3C73_397220 [compost metagenome]
MQIPFRCRARRSSNAVPPPLSGRRDEYRVGVPSSEREYGWRFGPALTGFGAVVALTLRGGDVFAADGRIRRALVSIVSSLLGAVVVAGLFVSPAVAQAVGRDYSVAELKYSVRSPCKRTLGTRGFSLEGMQEQMVAAGLPRKQVCSGDVENLPPDQIATGLRILWQVEERIRVIGIVESSAEFQRSEVCQISRRYIGICSAESSWSEEAEQTIRQTVETRMSTVRRE